MRIRHFKYAREVMAVLILVIAVLALYYTFIPAGCDDYTCFEAHMLKCKPATFINEEDEASWRYDIFGKN